ncbi:MAG: hypothetical protein AAF913_02980 [Pseudomonadota bacterium]
MSIYHFTSFVEELQGCSDHSDLHYAKMSKLLQHLYETARTPKSGSDSDFKKLVTNPDSIPDGYKNALWNLSLVWGKGGSKQYPYDGNRTKLRKVTMNRLVFRGDSRAMNLISSKGFEKWKPAMDVTYRNNKVSFPDTSDMNKAQKLAHSALMQTMLHGLKAGDIDPDSAVCVSPDFFVASMFPLPDKPSKLDTTWIYLCKVEQGYDTNGRQVMDALNGTASMLKDMKTEKIDSDALKVLTEKFGFEKSKINAQLESFRASRIFQLVYGRELAVDAIPFKKVFGGVRIKRTWNKLVPGKNGATADFTAGGTFKVEEIVINKKSDLAASMGEAAAIGGFFQKMTDAKKDGKVFKMPVASNGYKKTTATTASDIASKSISAVK